MAHNMILVEPDIRVEISYGSKELVECMGKVLIAMAGQNMSSENMILRETKGEYQDGG